MSIMGLESDLTGKVALVTGASRGIGAAIAEQLASQGAKVIGTATSAAGAEKITARLSSFMEPGLGVVLDVSDAKGIAEQVKGLSDAQGAPDILVNNAGITQDNLLLRMSADDWESVLNVNLNPIFYLVKALIKGMSKKRWGRIISISSVVASTGNPGQVNYAAAKAGVEGFTRSIAREMAKRGITANVVAPGYINTDMTAELSDDQKDMIMSSIPAGFIGEPKDIAQMVGFIASPAANYVNGQVLHVNGGMHMN